MYFYSNEIYSIEQIKDLLEVNGIKSQFRDNILYVRYRFRKFIVKGKAGNVRRNNEWFTFEFSVEAKTNLFLLLFTWLGFYIYFKIGGTEGLEYIGLGVFIFGMILGHYEINVGEKDAKRLGEKILSFGKDEFEINIKKS